MGKTRTNDTHADHTASAPSTRPKEGTTQTRRQHQQNTAPAAATNARTAPAHTRKQVYAPGTDATATPAKPNTVQHQNPRSTHRPPPKRTLNESRRVRREKLPKTTNACCGPREGQRTPPTGPRWGHSNHLHHAHRARTGTAAQPPPPQPPGYRDCPQKSALGPKPGGAHQHRCPTAARAAPQPPLPRAGAPHSVARGGTTSRSASPVRSMAEEEIIDLWVAGGIPGPRCPRGPLLSLEPQGRGP